MAEADRAGRGASARTLLLLERRLREAVDDERFEEAARLRDEICRLSG